MTKKIKILLALVLGGVVSVNSFAQELRVIGSSGNYTVGSSHSVAWTIGEPITATITSATNHVTQGFHQSDLYVLNVKDYTTAVEINVYPNPARDLINISCSEDLLMTIYDIQGKEIQSANVSTLTSSFDVSHLSRGTYTLVFSADGLLKKRMKVVIL